MADSAAPSQAIHSSALSREENYEQWRIGLASLFEANPLDGELDTFSADMATYNLGSFLIGKTSASPQTFQRDANLVSAVGVDHLLVQLYVNGSCEFDVEGYQTRGKAGDLVCFDLSRQMKSATTQLDTISLVVPRQLIRLSPTTFDTLHGAVLDGETSLGILLREHLLSLAKVAPRLGGPDGKLATEVAAVLISAGLSAAVTGQASEADLLGTGVQAIQGFIEKHLVDENLTPEMIMRHFGLSRSALYRTFEPLGGVADYIRDRRLNRAFLRLSSVGSNRGVVAKLAYMNGFSNEAAFSRAFRQRYGMNPREAIIEAGRRAASKSDVVEADNNWMQAWLTGLNAASARF
ncbi:helix-turn-helix domain-containing protein [Devosia sp. BK]|uniref:helix-turn-helix domain-containing protein n=1 Tax=Devosia sp. BK TaxID=2871706 RepID=UPI00293B220F|nr:helix-turn-helix domain-containing protein [Devosia sp. BK]MDV3252681.1 helix-turn-helix domain-containing protein [Devosia sp. BK]